MPLALRVAFRKWPAYKLHASGSRLQTRFGLTLPVEKIRIMNNNIPSFDEVILGCFSQDIGKLMQRAHGAISRIPAEVRRRESVILPVYNGRYGYKHVLWSEATHKDLNLSIKI